MLYRISRSFSLIRLFVCHSFLSLWLLTSGRRVCWRLGHKCFPCHDVSAVVNYFSYTVSAFYQSQDIWRKLDNQADQYAKILVKSCGRLTPVTLDGAIFISIRGLDNCSSKLFTQAFRLVRNVLGSWLSGKQPKKLPRWYARYPSKNNPNRSLSLGRTCWVCAFYLMRSCWFDISTRSSWGSFAWLPEYCH